ncbi:hypothetical protein ACFX1T_003449 [Malus domestica]
MKSGKVDSAAKVAPKPAPFAAEIDSPQIQDLKLAISELCFAAYAKKGVDELQRVCVSLLKKNEQLKGENDGLEASIGEVVREVSAQTEAAGGEAPDDAVAKSVTVVEGVGVELCKVVSHRVGSRMPYLQKKTKVKLIDYVACRQWIKLRICALACLTFHKNVRLYKSSAALLLEGQAVGSLPESVGYLSALGSSFRIPGQPSIGCTAGGIITLTAYSAELVRTFPDEIHLFGCFGLPIALRISRHGHMLLDAIFFEELRQIFAHELQAVVGDDGLRDAKSLDASLTCECQKSPLREYVQLKCARLPSGHRWAELLRSSENFASARVYAFIVAGLDSAE